MYMYAPAHAPYSYRMGVSDMPFAVSIALTYAMHCIEVG